MKLDPERIEWVSVVLGSCVIALFGQFLWLDIAFYLQSTVAVGEVTRLNHGGYHPQVTFTTDTGERISFPGSSSYPVEVGERLEVRYIRSTPHTGPKVNQKLNLLDVNLFNVAPILVGCAVVIAGLRGKLIFFGENDVGLPKK